MDSFTAETRTSIIIAHRQKRKVAMENPTPKVEVRTVRTEPYNMVEDQGIRLQAEGIPFMRIPDFVALSAVIRNPPPPIVKIMELTIIEEPYTEMEYCIGDFLAPQNFLVETKDKKVCTIRVQGLADDDNSKEMFQVGTKIQLFVDRFANRTTPCGEQTNVHFFIDERVVQRIFPRGRIPNMCRYCGKENARSSCGVCKVPYCNRKCKNADSKSLEHGLVCQQTEAITSGEPNLNSDESAKSHLMTPARTSLIRSFRLRYHNLFFNRKPFPTFAYAGEHVPDMEAYPTNPEPIVLKDMECDNIYENKILRLTNIEAPLTRLSYIHFLVEDETAITVMAVNNDERKMTDADKELLFRIGATFSVVNPFYKLGEGDGLPMIRVDDPRTIKPLGRKTNMCSFCGEENAEQECASCESRSYCGEECEELDQEILNHEMICKTAPRPRSMVVGNWPGFPNWPGCPY